MDPSIPRIKGHDHVLGDAKDMDSRQLYRHFKDRVEINGSPSLTHLIGLPLIFIGTPQPLLRQL